MDLFSSLQKHAAAYLLWEFLRLATKNCRQRNPLLTFPAKLRESGIKQLKYFDNLKYLCVGSGTPFTAAKEAGASRPAREAQNTPGSSLLYVDLVELRFPEAVGKVKRQKITIMSFDCGTNRLSHHSNGILAPTQCTWHAAHLISNKYSVALTSLLLSSAPNTNLARTAAASMSHYHHHQQQQRQLTSHHLHQEQPCCPSSTTHCTLPRSSHQATGSPCRCSAASTTACCSNSSSNPARCGLQLAVAASCSPKCTLGNQKLGPVWDPNRPLQLPQLVARSWRQTVFSCQQPASG